MESEDSYRDPDHTGKTRRSNPIEERCDRPRNQAKDRFAGAEDTAHEAAVLRRGKDNSGFNVT